MLMIFKECDSFDWCYGCCTAWCQRHGGFQGASKVIVIHLLMLRACVSVCVEATPRSVSVSVNPLLPLPVCLYL